MKDQHKLALIEIHEPWQALLCLPKSHVDRRGAFAAIARAPRARVCLVAGRVLSFTGFNRDNKATFSPFPAYISVKLEFEDTTSMVRFYNVQPAQFQDLKDQSVVIEATLEDTPRGVYFKSAVLGTVSGNIDPIYTGIQGQIAGDVVREAVQEALQDPASMAQACAAINQNAAIMQTLVDARRSPEWLLESLHTPRTLACADEALAIARKACINEIRVSARPSREQLPCPYSLDEPLKDLVSAQAETLSPSQRSALNVIRKSCNTVRPAHVLLNGDVGSGKTLVFLLAIAAIAKASQGKVAVLVPSDLVARQIHAQAVRRFPDLHPCLVSGDASADASPQEIERSSMYIGTQALLSRELPPMEAVVVDEQHKLSVEQRQHLLGLHTHVIEASATPIPRSLALALFDGWTYAIIAHSPVQKTIHSHVFDVEGRDEVMGMIKGHLRTGKKVVFLYPSVSGKGDSVTKKAQALGERFPGKVAMLHGKLKPEQKVKALESFRDGTCPIIAASTAIEVGVDVPDVGMMVVTGADRFGASQLHQLRGRLVRNGGAGDFVMIAPKGIGAATRKRLQAVADHSDGFSLAQKDLELRGFGELLGDMQTGGATTLFKLSRLAPEDFLAA